MPTNHRYVHCGHVQILLLCHERICSHLCPHTFDGDGSMSPNAQSAAEDCINNMMQACPCLCRSLHAHDDKDIDDMWEVINESAFS